MSTHAFPADCRFGRFELRPTARQLLVDGQVASLGPRAFDLLVVLVAEAGRLMSKAELLDRVWPGLIVEENNLQVQVSALRKVLGVDAIATIPGRGYRLTLQPEALGAPAPPAPAPGPAAIPSSGLPSVAVLPFVNMSDDAANEYFADGLSEELVSVLSKIRGLRVASRTSAFSFKDTNADLPTIGRRLNVSHILEGSVRKAGPRVRVTAQLIDVETDSHRWSQAYDRELEDIFAVQDDIAQSVVTEIRAALLGVGDGEPGRDRVRAEVEAAARGRSRDAEAYRLYLQGSFFLNRDTEADVARAIELFGRAVARDPAYARAWASLSFSYFHQAANAWSPIPEGTERARAAALRAREVGPDVAAGHWAMGALLMYRDWDWRGAEAALRRALQLAPENSQLVLAAKLMQDLGQMGEAEALIEQALALDPLNAEAYMTAGWQAIYAGRLAGAEDAFRRALELSPQRVRIHYGLARVHLLQGRPDAALREAELEAHPAFRLLGLALVQHDRGCDADSAAALAELCRAYTDGAAYQIAEAYAYRGDAASAFAWLGRARRQHDAGLAGVKIDPLLRGVHGDPRWTQFLRTIGLAGCT